MAAVQESLAQRFDRGLGAGQLRKAGEDLLSVVDLLAGQRLLRTTLADPAISNEVKNRTMNQLLAGKITDLANEVLDEIIGSRWSSPGDMVDATEIAGVSLVIMGAEKKGTIDRVEEELFRFGRAIDANADLQMALTNPATSSEAKQGIVHSLLDGKCETETVTLLVHAVGSLRGRRVQTVVVELSELAAARRGRLIADVRSAVPLTDTQQQRLAAALAKLHGRRVELNIDVDPAVIGGIEVTIGDDVIDGTVLSKIEQARRKMAG